MWLNYFRKRGKECLVSGFVGVRQNEIIKL